MSDAKELLGNKFKQLPGVVQKAISSAHVEEHIRALAERHRLHLDDGVILENELMMVLLGVQPIDELPKNLARELEIGEADAQTIALDASETIFRPIEVELEQALENPNAEPREEAEQDATRREVLATARAEEARVSGTSAEIASTTIEKAPRSLTNDPYREPVA